MASDDITYCDDCDNLTLESARGHPSRWQCIKFPRRAGFQFVSETWTEEPYMRCININGGMCPLFTPIRVPEAPAEGKRIHRSDIEQNRKPTGQTK